MPVPKRRLSSSKRDMRRSQHDKVSAPHVVPCSNCSAPSLAHRVCPTCGHYAGRSVVSQRSEEATEESGA